MPWMTDLKINPFQEEEMWFNTGTGVFRSRNLTAAEVTFEDWSDGIEETVHLNLYSPPAGEVKVIDILGDLGGFAFRKLNTDRQMYGKINSMEGDSQVYGRFYIATGSRGVLYGEPVE